MARNKNVEYSTIHPGVILGQELEKRGIRQKDFASTIGMPSSVLNSLIKGKRSFTPDIAILLEAALDKEASYWLSLQSARDIEVAKMKTDYIRKQEEIETWRSIQDYCNTRILDRFIDGGLGSNTSQKINTVLNFFGVRDINQLRTLFVSKLDPAYFRKSAKRINDPISLFTWQYMAFASSMSYRHKIESFTNTSVAALVNDLKPIFFQNKQTEQHLIDLLAQYGIKLIFLPNENGTHIDGFSFWKGNNPTITLTLRGKKLDILAFTLLHEIYHVYYHLDKLNQDITCISIDGEKTSRQEQDADKFANDQLISPIDWQIFIARNRGTSHYAMGPYIRDFALEHQIHPSIVLGRYQHDYQVFDNGRGIERSIN